MKSQSVIFKISKTLDGKKKTAIAFYPPLAKTQESFEKLSYMEREMQLDAFNIGNKIMKDMFKEGKE